VTGDASESASRGKEKAATIAELLASCIIEADEQDYVKIVYLIV